MELNLVQCNSQVIAKVMLVGGEGTGGRNELDQSSVVVVVVMVVKEGERRRARKVAVEVLLDIGVVVVGAMGGLKIVSQVHLHLSFFIIMCPPSKHFYNHCLQYTEKCFYNLKGACQRGNHCPFSHKCKLICH